MWIYFVLIGMLVLSLVTQTERLKIKNRKASDWALDLTSLTVHFLVIPVLQVAVVYKLYEYFIPQFKGSIQIGWGLALMATLLVDYGWYWNHRLFHARTPLWNLHAVHHAPKNLDILASSRNTIWSPFFMVYFWLTPLILFLAVNPAPFLTLAGFGLFINFWGHTGFDLRQGSWPERMLSLAIIQPRDHHWHHSAENPHCNFATVFNLWDKAHGTWHAPGYSARTLGFDLPMSLWRQMLFPIEKTNSNGRP